MPLGIDMPNYETADCPYCGKRIFFGDLFRHATECRELAAQEKDNDQ